MSAYSSKRLLGFRYDPTTIALHWLVAALVAAQWVGGRTIDWFPKGELRIDARSVHILVGAILAAAMALRVYWKLFRAAKAPAIPGDRLDAAARTAHWGLLLTVGAVAALGLILEGLRGDSLFNLTRLPALGPFSPPERHATANQITDWHALAANLLLIFAALHAGAALVHHFILRDDVLRRMR
jgi:cytochrome b561